MEKEGAMQLFEDAVAGWRDNLATCRGGDGNHSVNPPEFVRVMSRVAAEFGSVSCHALDKETLCFTIGETETRTYTFLPFHALRVLLAAISHVFWEQEIAKTGKIGSNNFNSYGDKREIGLKIDGQQTRFEVEISNTNGKSLFFRIRRL